MIGVALLALSSFAQASNCPAQSITVASGGTVVTDLSNCTTSGINGYQSPPQHGVNDSRNNNSTGLVYYTNNGDSSTTDSFSVFDGDDNSVIPFSVTVQQAGPSVTTTTLPDATVGTGYSQSLAASGGSTPYTWSLIGGSLPNGLTLSSAGVVSGTPTQAGSFNPVFRVADSASSTASRAIALNVSAPTLAITPTTLPNPVIGTAYNQTLGTSGGTAPYTYSVSGGTVPPGISVSSVGNVSGNATTPGNYSFTVSSTDSSTGAGAPFSTTRTYSVTTSAPTITVAPVTLPNPTVGVAYSQTVSASGGTAPYTFAITAGALPAGMNLAGGGALSGTPTAAGTFNFTVTATDNGGFNGSRAYTITVAAPTIAIAPASLPNAVAGQAYSSTVTASGGTAPYAFAVTGGTLPSGITLSSTGVLSGTSTVDGTFNFTVSATDSSSGAGAPFSGSRAYSLTVGAPSVVVAPVALPNPTVGVAYSQTVTASGGTAPYTLVVTAGATPSGLSLSAAGVLSGTPTAAGTFNFTVTATDSNGFDGARAYTVAVGAPTITITPVSLPSGISGQAYSTTLAASGGIAPYTYAISGGGLPSGIVLSPSGVLSGTPTSAGTFNFSVSATDSSSGAGAPFSGSQAYALVVASPTLTLPPSTLSGGTAGEAYMATINTASGGIAPYTYTLTAGALPPGVTVSSATGTLSGTPTGAGNFAFTLTATDSTSGSAGQASQSYNLSIGVPTLLITPSTLPSGTTGVAYNQVLSTSGGLAPYSYAISAGALPGGLTLTAGGVLSGSPVVAGSFTFTVSVTDASGFGATQSYTVGVAASVPVPIAVNDNGATVTDKPLTLSVTGNDTGSIDSIAVSAPPSHGTVVVNGLQLVYTPASDYVGIDTVAYSASGPGGTSAPATVTITVNARPIAVSASADAVSGEETQVDLTRNASGGPFVAAAVIAVLPSNAGTASIARVGGAAAARASGPTPAAVGDTPSFQLTFTPNAAFSGQATVRFTLSNNFATSDEASIIFNVAPRRDPTLDAEVRGLIDAQAETTRRFARAQIDNFQRRLEATHRGGAGFTSGLSFQPTSNCPQTQDGLGGYACAATREQAAEEVDGDRELLSQPSQDQRDLGLWATGTVRSGNLSRQSGRAGVDFQSDGLSGGADYRVTPSWTVGAGFGWGRDDSDVGRNGSRSQSTAYTMALYGSFHPGQTFFLDTLVGYQLLSYDLHRYTSQDTALVSGKRSGSQWLASLSTGADLQRGAIQLTPYARLDLARATLESYDESSAAPLALHYEDMDVATTTGNMGMRLEWRHEAAWGRITPQLRVEYQRDFQGRGDATLRYADLMDGPFYSTGLTTFDRNRLMLGVGATFVTTQGLSTRLEYRGISDGDSGKDQALMLNIEKQY